MYFLFNLIKLKKLLNWILIYSMFQIVLKNKIIKKISKRIIYKEWK